MKTYSSLYWDELVIESNEIEFAPYLCEPVKKLICKQCNGDKWVVGSGSYYTAIKCPHCKYTLCVHEG